MAEIQEQSGQRLFPMAHRCRGGTSTPRCAEVGAGARDRAAGHQHQRRPAERGPPRPRPTGTGTRCGRRAPTSAMPVNFHIGASDTSMSWFGSMPWPSLDDERKLALGSAMMMISNFRTIGNLMLLRRARAHPDAAGRVGGERARLDPVPARGARLPDRRVRAAHRRPPLDDAVGVLPAPDARLLLVRARQPRRCDRPRSGPTTSCSRPTSRTRRASTPTAWSTRRGRSPTSSPACARKILSTNAATLYRIPLPDTTDRSA